MAVITFYDDVFGSVGGTIETPGGKAVRSYIEDYFKEHEDKSLEIETYDLKTGETSYKSMAVSSYKVAVVVNGEESTVDYVVGENDVIHAVFVPERLDDAASNIVSTIGSITSIVGSLLVMTGVGAGIGWGLVAIGAGLSLWGGINTYLNNKDTDSSKSSSSLDSEAALSLSGGGNNDITGNRYPIILGKHLVNPYKAASEYNVTYTEDIIGKDAGQYIKCLYCVGYAPLKITDIKIGEVWTAYNRSTGSAGDSEYTHRNTVMHGNMDEVDTTEADAGEILRKWKNNDLSIEILQKGKLAESVSDMYGTIYSKKVAQLDVGANLINIKDGLMSEVATRVYKGVSVPNGFQTNSVRFSESCPRRLEVEIDFPSGLYAQRSNKGDLYYYELPVRLAVQWRFVRDGQNSSDALDPKGWNNFDFIQTKAKNYSPEPYTLAKKMYDYNSALGKTDYLDLNDKTSLTEFVLDDNWIADGTELFEFGCTDEPDNIKNSKFYTKNSYAPIFQQGIVDAESLASGKFYLDAKCSQMISADDGHKYTFRYWAQTEAFGCKSVSCGVVTPYKPVVEISEETYKKFISAYGDTVASDRSFTAWDIDGNGEEKFDKSVLSSTKRSNPFTIIQVYTQVCMDGDDITVYKKWSDSQDADSETIYPFGLASYSKSSDDERESSSERWVRISDSDYNSFLSAYPDGKCSKNNSREIQSGLYKIYRAKQMASTDVDKIESIKEDLESSEYTKSICGSGHSPSDYKASYGVHERRYVVVKEFTEEECRQLVNFNTDSKVSMDSVEVRVLRITPSYMEQTDSDDDDWSDMTYQDLCKWTSLRTECFDKDAYKEALEAAEKSGTLSSVSVKDYPQRPQTEEDMDKFCYVALRLKQDAAETGGSSLNAVSMIAQSFTPKYSEKDGTWNPKPDEITRKYKYFKSETDDDGNDIQTEITADEYEAADDKVLLTKKDVGTNYLDVLKKKIFTEQTPVTDGELFPKYLLSEEVEEKYIDNNTASVFALALLGPHLGREAKTYSDINLTALTDAYEFCGDLTDGTPDDDSSDGLKHFKMSCNGIVSSEVKLSSLLDKILATGRCGLKRDDENKYEIVPGRKKNYPVMLLNQQNCLSKSNTRSFDDIPSGLQVSFTDETDNFTQNDVYIMRDGESYKNPSGDIEAYTFQYVTSREQIWTLGRYNLGCRVFQRESYTRKVGKAGYILSYGDMVLLQDETLVVGTDRGARIRQVIYDDNNSVSGKEHRYIYGIITDEPFQSTGETENGLNKQGVTIMQAGKAGHSRCVTLRLADIGRTVTNASGTFSMIKGLTNVMLFADVIAIKDGDTGDGKDNALINEDAVYMSVQPSCGDVVAFGYVGEITIKASVVSLKQQDKAKFEVSLVPYDEKLYSLGKKMVEFKSHMTQPVRELSDAEFTDKVTQSSVNSSVISKTSALSSSLSVLQETIDSSAEAPVVQVTPDAIGIAVNDETRTLKAQTFDVDISVMQFGEKLDFFFLPGTFNIFTENSDTKGKTIPLEADAGDDDEVTYSISGTTVTFTVKEDVVFTTKYIKFWINYQPALPSAKYVADTAKEDADKNIHGVDSEDYGERKGSGSVVRKEIVITATGIQGGRYLGYVLEVGKTALTLAQEAYDSDGKFTGFENSDRQLLIETLVAGDYFTYVGEDETKCEYVDKNILWKSCQYEFLGAPYDDSDIVMWRYSQIQEHIGRTLSDALASMEESLAHNNSHIVQFLDHLTANSIFVNKLVANEAFIRKLGTNELHIDSEGENTGKIYGGAYDSDGNASGTGGGFYLGADGTVKIKGELVIGGTGQSVSDAISDATSASEFTYTRLYYYSSTGTTPDAPAGFKTTSILNTWTSSASAPSKTARTYYSYCYRTGSGTYTYGEVSQNAAEIDSAIATAESNANDYAKAQADAAEKTAKSYADTQATAAKTAAESTFNTWKNGDYAKSLSDLQSQVDGKAEAWYQPTDPSSSWTIDDKAKHVGDLWLCTDNVMSETTVKYKKDSTYIYQKGTGEYSWAEQQVPSEVFDKIDGKAAVYVERPSSYKANDLWILSKDTTLDKTVYSEGEVLVATQDAESFSEKDWKKKFRYTDDTAANKALNARRVVKRTTIYYMKQSRLYDQPNMPDAPASKDGVSDTQLSDEGWSSVYPNTKSFVQTVTCGSVVYESEAIVYSCEMTEISENSKTSYEFSEVVKDFTGEILDAKVHGDTLIEGRYINTGLIDADTLLAQNIAMKKNGVIRSVNYTGKISSDGVITTPAHGMSSDQLYLDLSKYEPRFFLHEIKAGETEDIYLSILPFSCLLYFIKQDGKTPSGLKPVSQEQLTISSPSYTNNGANYYDIDISGIGSDEVTKKIVYADMGSSASSLMIRLKNSGSSTVYIYTYTQGGIDKEIAEKVSGGKGWAIDYKGNADFNGGNFNSITVSGQSTFQGLMKQGLQSYKGVFLSFIYYNNDVKVINSGLKGLKVERMKISGWYRVTINRKEITSDSMLSALNSIAEMNTHFVGVEVITASDYMVSKKFTYTATTEETIETVSCNETTTTTVTKGSTVEESQYIGAHPMCHVNCHAIAPTDLYFADQKKRHNFQSDMSVSETQHEYLMTPYLRKINKVSNNVNSVIKNSDPAEAVGFSNMYVTDNEIQFCLVFTDFNTDKYEDVLGGCSLVLNFYGTNVNIK